MGEPRMSLIGGRVGYRLLRAAQSVSPGNEITTAYEGLSKMEVLFGPAIWNELADKVVVDFGCESGDDSIDMARHGVPRVIGIDIRERPLEHARKKAAAAGVADRCSFVREMPEKVDVIVSLDAFEHFGDPLNVLRIMRGLLKD